MGGQGKSLEPHLTILGLGCTVIPQATQGCEARRRGSVTRWPYKEPLRTRALCFRRLDSADGRMLGASAGGRCLAATLIFPGPLPHSSGPHPGRTYGGRDVTAVRVWHQTRRPFTIFSAGGPASGTRRWQAFFAQGLDSCSC